MPVGLLEYSESPQPIYCYQHLAFAHSLPSVVVFAQLTFTTADSLFQACLSFPAVQGVVATLLGFFVLGGVEPHVVNVLGILLNTAGGVWYTVIKYRRKAINLTQHDRDGAEQELLHRAPSSRVEHQPPLSAGPSTTALHSLIERRPSGVV